MLTRRIVRVCRFSPYRKGMGPSFSLTVWDMDERDGMGKNVLGYELHVTFPNVKRKEDKRRLLFCGSDFHCSPLHSVDCDETIASLMTFLTLRPGDTDAEYFANYTPDQLAYCEQHAKALACEVANRFGER